LKMNQEIQGCWWS